jgi:hypothetical protein
MVSGPRNRAGEDISARGELAIEDPDREERDVWTLLSDGGRDRRSMTDAVDVFAGVDARYETDAARYAADVRVGAVDSTIDDGDRDAATGSSGERRIIE